MRKSPPRILDWTFGKTQVHIATYNSCRTELYNKLCVGQSWINEANFKKSMDFELCFTYWVPISECIPRHYYNNTVIQVR